MGKQIFVSNEYEDDKDLDIYKIKLDQSIMIGLITVLNTYIDMAIGKL